MMDSFVEVLKALAISGRECKITIRSDFAERSSLMRLDIYDQETHQRGRRLNIMLTHEMISAAPEGLIVKELLRFRDFVMEETGKEGG